MVMRRVGVAELKNNLSRNLRLVESGEVIEVTDHDRAIARLVPIETKSRLVIREPTRPFSEVAHRRYPPLKLPMSSTELLRKDRDIR
jgi:prevent-host-death family protein